MDSTADDAIGRQLQVRFVTKLSQYAVRDAPFSIPASVDPDGLNQLVHEVLKGESDSDASPPEFDFLVGGEFLRSSLDILVQEKGVSTEDVIEVEYVEKLPAPEPFECLMHDDWVSAAHCFGKWILTGCYDNMMHIWNDKGKHLLNVSGHAGPVKAVRWITNEASPELESQKEMFFVSASQDQTVRLWKWAPDMNVVTPVFVGCGHQRSVEAVTVDPNGRMFATGSFDTMLKIWSANPEEEDGDDRGDAKKAKGDEAEAAVSGQLSKRVPLMTLSGHSEAVTAVVWPTAEEVVTASWDQTIRIWDAEMGGVKSQIAGTRAFVAADWAPAGRTGAPLLTASADRHVRLYDPRSPEGNLVKLTFTAHSGWVTCVRWARKRPDLFISGGHDMKLRLWDIRSPKVALYEMEGHEAQIMCCDWSVDSQVVSGGSDNTLRIFSVASRLD